ncbi:Flavin reductase like domain-containing protein [Mesorhizobium albiziae]|uniref:Flavin reductase like domain-containing protein n=1 Tax=Neomesorhizobium albiziae TaxID=335020 RepID=A0A1I4F1K6_9HYPH|nr:flavin reductase [Mesorhizobium albiziae]GLS31066.1 hypothetical protein GCM10007937_27750 [Mesorhizobium albiziae]SFL11449.1 Flavin reductase like domain-containing protein [Mesorhizobium albiziae]
MKLWLARHGIPFVEGLHHRSSGWDGNRSHFAIRESRECVINVPTIDLADQVVAIGNSHVEQGDKFAATDLTPGKSQQVNAPLAAECYANFECRLFDGRMVDEYGFFIWEIVKAQWRP